MLLRRAFSGCLLPPTQAARGGLHSDIGQLNSDWGPGGTREEPELQRQPVERDVRPAQDAQRLLPEAEAHQAQMRRSSQICLFSLSRRTAEVSTLLALMRVNVIFTGIDCAAHGSY